CNINVQRQEEGQTEKQHTTLHPKTK
ncbi:MAG: hypothetical protein ACI90V_011435, partial [Bacillariaceae sp.]